MTPSPGFDNITSVSDASPHPPSRDKEDRQRPASSLKPALLQHAYSGTQLAVSVLLGLYAGYWLDGRWGTSPWLTLLGAALGLAAGLYSFLKPFFRDESK